MKNNIEFYRHSAQSDQHPKFKMLRNEYGWAGEGKFWALNNRIAQAEDCILDISKKYNKASLANDLEFPVDELDKFILFLINDCELIFETANGGLTSEQVQENYMSVTEMRKRNQRNYNKYKEVKNNLKNNHSVESDIQSIENNNKSVESIQSKVKESKVKKNKRKAPQKEVDIIIKDLNSRLDTNYSCFSVNTNNLIAIRMAEGFSTEDFIIVNEKKCNEWKDNPNMSQYLRPETLYSNKFEGYLNQIIKEKPNNINKVDNAINELKEEYVKTGGTWSDIKASIGSVPKPSNIKRIS
tara:strand:- start:3883 stop:4776 length:894 start_codon:yes stop_codon:yes gene_type:complete